MLNLHRMQRALVRYSMAFYIAAQKPFETPNKAHGLLMFSKLYSSEL